jgi:hypothetical protein
MWQAIAPHSSGASGAQVLMLCLITAAYKRTHDVHYALQGLMYGVQTAECPCVAEPN